MPQRDKRAVLFCVQSPFAPIRQDCIRSHPSFPFTLPGAVLRFPCRQFQGSTPTFVISSHVPCKSLAPHGINPPISLQLVLQATKWLTSVMSWRPAIRISFALSAAWRHPTCALCCQHVVLLLGMLLSKAVFACKSSRQGRRSRLRPPLAVRNFTSE